jgi:N-succinyldiaminopimelate aminotransferase
MPSRSHVCKALAPFGTSIFTEMTSLANAHGAVNLSQGFPDFDGPEKLRELAARAILRGPNQYAPSSGLPILREAVAAKMRRFHAVDVDPDREVTITAGATEGLAATLLGLLEPGDEVVLFEPFYDLYPAMIARAGARPVVVPLAAPRFELDGDALRRALSPRTRAILVNNPQNPCGKVWTAEELSLIAGICERHELLVLGDEVYEHILFDGRVHRSLLTVPGLRERALVISSTAKTFSMTGWKVGMVVAAPSLTEAVRAAHQFLTFATPGPLQEAMASGIAMDDAYYRDLEGAYARRRECLCGGLETLGLRPLWPEGAYYVTLPVLEDDFTAARRLATEAGVAVIPFSAFYEGRRGGRDLLRLCFCKRDETLDLALERLGDWLRRRGGEPP